MVTRMHTGATPTFMLNTQIANGLELGPGLLFDRRVNALMELARTVVNWSSDCYSYFKEAERTADGYNIIDVLMDTHNLSVEAAMAMAFNMQDRMLMRFVELRDEVLNGPHDKGAEIYIDALEEYTIGGSCGVRKPNVIDLLMGRHQAGWLIPLQDSPGKQGAMSCQSQSTSRPSPGGGRWGKSRSDGRR